LSTVDNTTGNFFKTVKSYILGEKIVLLIIVLLCFLTVDVVINQISDVLAPFNRSAVGISLFVAIAIVYSIGQYGIMKFISKAGKSIQEKSFIIKRVHEIVKNEQLVLTSIIWLIIVEIIFTAQYQTFILEIIATISLGLTVGLALIFAQRFIKWYGSNPTSKAVLVFGLAFAVYGLSFVPSLVSEIFRLPEQEQIRTSSSEVFFPDTAEEKGAFFQSLSLMYNYLKLSGFVLLLGATTLLIFHYKQKIGKIKFWIVILLPLFYYMSTVIDVFGIYIPESDNEIMLYYGLAAVNQVAGGILFAIPFLTMAKSVKENDPTRKYMITAALGFVLFFGLNNTTLFIAPYPPFGIAALSISALATYMIFTGIYSTAVSISLNMQLRQSIRRLALKESSLLSSIGTAQMDSQVRSVINKMKDVIKAEESELEQQAGIETNITQNDMEDYMKIVLEEASKARKKTAPG
jgi:hypothetical protein